MAVRARKLKSDEIQRFRKEPSWIKYLPYSYHVTAHIISTITGEYLIMFRVPGRTHDCASNAEMLNWHHDLNELLKAIGNEHVKLWTHLHHRKVGNYPKSAFTQTFARMFDENYGRSFEDVPLMVNDIYLSVMYNPVGDLTQKLFAKFERPSAQDLRDLQAESVAALEEIADQLMGAMQPYGIERLGIYYRDKRGNVIASVENKEEADETEREDLLADSITEATPVAPEAAVNQHAFSSALEWLGFLANGEGSLVPVCRDRIRTYLMTNRLVSSTWGDVLQIRTPDRNFYVAGVEIRDYDEETEPGQLNMLMEADFEFVLTQSFVCMSQGAAHQFLNKQELSLMETHDSSGSQILGMRQAKDDVVSRRFIMGWHHCTIHAYGETPKEAQKGARKARVMLTQCSITGSPVGLASEAAYYAMLPGNQTFAPRPAPINSWNFLCFASFHNFMSGKPNGNPWGPAVMLFKTVAGTALFFNFHISPLDEDWTGKRPAGVTLILGRIGSGKTMVLCALLTQSMKFRPRVFIWDKDQGMAALVKALEGHYTVMREGEPCGLQPCQMKPTKRNIAFVKRLVRLLAETSLGGPIEHLEVQAINRAVDALMDENSRIDIELRNMTTLCQHIENPHRTGLEERPTVAELLEPWCRGQQHGWLFDNDSDTLDVTTHDINAFDITEFIVSRDQPAPPARAPMLMYLHYRVRESIDGKRHCIQVFDEFAQYLDDPTMEVEIKRGIKTDRKKDCIYVFSTQEPNDALDSRIGKSVMQAVVTRILLENPDADPGDYMDKGRGGLTASEYEALMSIPENSRQMLIKQGSQSAMVQMKLRNMEREISVLSGTPDNAERLEQIIEAMGTDNPDVWLPKYWEAVLGKGAPGGLA